MEAPEDSGCRHLGYFSPYGNDLPICTQEMSGQTVPGLGYGDANPRWQPPGLGDRGGRRKDEKEKEEEGRHA